MLSPSHSLLPDTLVHTRYLPHLPATTRDCPFPQGTFSNSCYPGPLPCFSTCSRLIYTLRGHTPILCLVHLHLSSLSSWTPLPSNPTSSSSLTFPNAPPLTCLLFLLTHCLSSLNSSSFPSSTSPLMCPHSCPFPVLEAELYAQREADHPLRPGGRSCVRGWGHLPQIPMSWLVCPLLCQHFLSTKEVPPCWIAGGPQEP